MHWIVWLAVALVLPSWPLAAAESSAADQAYKRGTEALHSRDYATAASAFEQATELRPEGVDAWLNLGICMSALQNWDGAIRAYERTIELDPEHTKAHHNLGNVHYRRGALDEAVVYYSQALELDPEYMLAAFHKGWTLRELNRGEEAEPAFKRCLEIPAKGPRQQRTRVDCMFGLGSLRHRAGDYLLSATLMEQVLSVHPGHPEARYYLGIAYRQQGRLEDAERQLEVHRQMLSARRQPVPMADEPTKP